MGKKEVIGTCALCKKDEVKLCESHIIPKGVYKRAKRDNKKTYKKINRLTGERKTIQSGEKENLLCIECEKLFNKYETDFINHFYDPYRKSGYLNTQKNIDNFIFSLSWRILFLDLIASKSELSNLHSMVFEHMEVTLREYLMSLNRDKVKNKHPETLENHIFRIDKLLEKDPLIFEAFKQQNILNSYMFIDIDCRKSIVLAYFDNFLIVTELDIEKFIKHERKLNNNIDISLFNYIKITTEELAKKELIHDICQSVRSSSEYYNPSLRQIILKKYEIYLIEE